MHDATELVLLEGVKNQGSGEEMEILKMIQPMFAVAAPW